MHSKSLILVECLIGTLPPIPEDSVETKDRLKLLGKLLEQLKTGWIFVEGQKDRKALEELVRYTTDRKF